ncbi:MAG: hypothetical protein AB7R89_06115 [Dehalococcoidia bacterium]
MAGKTRLKKRDRAVALLARGDRSHEQIATELKIASRTLRNWLSDPAFAAELEAAKGAIRDALCAEGVAAKQNRLDSYRDRHQRMQQVIEARADANRKRNVVVQSGQGKDLDFDGYTAAGAETGIMVHTVTYLKDGRREEWAIDTGLLKEMRELEKQAATEMGQWDDGKANAVLKHLDLTKLTAEQLERIANGDDPIQVLLAG